VLLAAFAVGFLPPVAGTAIEIVFRATVPGLYLLWKLNFLFPLAVAYAIVRYDLFDLRAVLRLGTIYTAATVLAAAAYAGTLTALNFGLASLDMAASPVVGPVTAALVVVLLVNPAYGRLRTVVDRTFFRERYDAQRAIEGVAGAMTTVLELPRITGLITATVEEVFHPRTVRLWLAGETGFRPADASGREVPIAADSPLVRACERSAAPLSRERLAADPALADLAAGALAAMAPLDAALVVPVVFQERVTALLVLGPRRAETAYSRDDVRLLRHLANQAAVALENARAYTALQAALRRVQILESMRANLAKFVPRTVRELIEDAPEAPALAKRDVDVSVLFVDVVGYTRLSERLDAATLNAVIERYFGAFLDEILARGGDVNETAGDGLMVIFQDPDERRHAEAAVATGLRILERARELNEDHQPGPIALHVGANSGVAALGATRIEGAAGTRWTYTASGPVTNLAARLAALGEGDAVVIGAQTRRRLGPGFAVEDAGVQRLRNVEEPVQVFRVAAASIRAPSAAAARC
jgi:class 3 adenylate cyclase